VITDGSNGATSAFWLNNANEKITCEFTYDSQQRAEKPVAKEVNVYTLITQITKKYQCLNYRSGIFQYEVCLGGEIKQSANNEHYSLGRYEKFVEGVKTPQQLYLGGTNCDAAGNAPRESIVEFTCSQEARVVGISEPSTCKYTVTVGVPEVCGHSAFVASTASFETWVLEVSEMEDGGYICQVFNNGFDAQDTVPFSTFKLGFKNSELTLSDSLARTANRRLIDKSLLVSEDTPPSIQSASNFGYNTLAYAFVKTQGDR